MTLLLATRTAHAVEWQCGPHYVSTSALHTERVEDTYKHIIAYPVYNRSALRPQNWIVFG